jgi:lysyl-tRNA synthetase class 2
MLRGDIVEVAVRTSGRRLWGGAYQILVRPADDPVDIPKSMYSRLGHRRNILRIRSKMLSLMRTFFLDRGFMELTTPTLVPSPGMEAHLAGFETSYIDLNGTIRPFWLPTSPEFALKKALCAGFEKVFDIRPAFRNRGEVGPLHQPEFTMVEWYRAYEDYRRIMSDTEELVASLAWNLREYLSNTFRGIPISWEPPYPLLSVAEAFDEYAGIDLFACLHDEELFRRSCCKAVGRGLSEDEDWVSLFCRVMIELIEPHLGIEKPLLLYDYPAQLAALAIVKADQPLFAERFELYVAGVEIANAFTELNDPREMARRIRGARREQKKAGMTPSPVDGELLRALRQGMPPAGGIALGFDRLLMALLGVHNISSIVAFPHETEHAKMQNLSRLR